MFQALLAVPIVGAALLVAALVGADLAELLRGSLRETFTTVAGTLMSEPAALAAFFAAFAIVLLGGSAFMFLVKGGTVEVLAAAEAQAGPIEREPLTYETTIRQASGFTLERFVGGCRRMFRRYMVLGLLLMVVYGVSGTAYLAFVLYGYRTAGDQFLVLGWGFVAAVAAIALVAEITVINWLYLLLQIAIAVDDVGIPDACLAVARFMQSRFRELVGVFSVVLGLIVVATFTSALAWSTVGLIAFVPLVGLAVFPVQIVALLVRGLVFEYITLTALAAYTSLYHQHVAQLGAVSRRIRSSDGFRATSPSGL
jgi:hypothetical protein